MKLTPKEEQRILNDRALEKMNQPVKRGILKEDLFFVPSYDGGIILEDFSSYVTESKLQSQLEKFQERVLSGKKIPKGTEFTCRLFFDTESWEGRTHGAFCSNKNTKWAEQHLENIQEIKP